MSQNPNYCSELEIPYIIPQLELFSLTNLNTDDTMTQIKLSIAISIFFVIMFHLLFRWFCTSETMVKMLLNITLAASFISIFYFTAGYKIETNIIKTQVNNVVSDLTTGMSLIIPDQLQKQLASDLQNIKPDTSQQNAADVQAAQSNALLIKKTIITIAALFGIFVIYAILQYSLSDGQHKKESIKHVVTDNVVLLIAIGLTEFFFLFYVGQNYRSGDPNKVKLEIIKNVQNMQPIITLPVNDIKNIKNIKTMINNNNLPIRNSSPVNNGLGGNDYYTNQWNYMTNNGDSDQYCFTC